MGAFVWNLDDIGEGECDLVGGKGYALARLRQAGFPVPAGFVVTSDAYRAFVAFNDLRALTATLSTDGDLAAGSARVKAAFEDAEMPSAIAAAICGAYRGLGEGKVAVRSSALAEDSEAASFAGQYETVLEVVGCDALLAALRRCWASLWSERALIYRHHLGVSDDVAMAVSVQRMVPAAQAGVAFTLDPVSGCRDVLVVEAVAGLGESLVGGRVTSCRYIVQREDDSPRTERGVLGNDQLAAVVHLAQKVESWAGRPQDVEWALDETGDVHLLQARPITAMGDTAREGVTLWTRDNVGEVIPDVVTPLSWSVLDPLGNCSFAALLRRLEIDDYPGAGLFGRFYGRVYFNQTLFQEMMSRFYPSRAGWRAIPRLALTALRALLLLHRLPTESERVVATILEHRRSEDNLSSWQRLGTEAMEVHLAVSVMAELLYQALDKLLKRWVGGMTTAAALTAGVQGVRSAEAGQALAALAEQVRQDRSLQALVLTANVEALPARLAETEAGRALWAQIEAFLSEHGHSAAQEFELAVPRWRDDPTIILNALRVQARAREVSVADPSETCLEATRQVEKRLGWLKCMVFRRLLCWAQVFVATRENLKYHFVIAHGRLRDLYLALATRLVADGRLRDSQDVFFLTAEEVVLLAEGGLEAAPNLVDERRQAWETDRRIVPPSAFEQRADGRLCSVSLPLAASSDSGGRLRGIAASPGSYTGWARIMLTPDDGAGVQPGEVLVVPATNPGWAPLLLGAGALVTEIGGILSHGAIIAREYGLPAVLNISGATQRIRTGQLVHVDGSQGVVRILEEGI